jgi:GAF domain-containing protein
MKTYATHQLAASLNNESVRRALGVERGCREALSDLTFLAASYLDAPFAGVSVIGNNETHYLTSVGGHVTSIPSTVSICFDVAEGQTSYLLSGYGQNAKLAADSTLGMLGIRAYAGVPLMINDIYRGALCVMDRDVRFWSTLEVEALQSLARVITHQLEQSCA